MNKPLLLVTGAAGNLGRSVAAAFASEYQVVGLDRGSKGLDFPIVPVDLASDESVSQALSQIRLHYGSHIASVIHLAAYFDFTGEDNPLYREVNVAGTRRLLSGLRQFTVEQFVYSSTMLVHAPCGPGERIDENWPIEPRWAYPRSKAAAEQVIREAHGSIPYVILRFAGVYDEQSSVPTLANQIARIYERLFASLSLSWRFPWARWLAAGIGALVMAAPFVFWTQNPAAYLSDTMAGMLIFGFAVGTKPEPGPCAIARMTGSDVPPGWSYNPSSWTQRIPIIALALVGLYVSRYLAAYQLGHIDDVWEPFFQGSEADPQNGTEEIITSHVSKAWPVPDAALGGYTYALEILTGIVGSRARWRTMPWLVLLFGLMIVPLSVVSMFFIIIQPIEIGTWSTLALIGAAAMLIQIPYSLDELLAVAQFLRRRVRAGRNLLSVLLFGDTDGGEKNAPGVDEFERSPKAIIADMFSGGVSLPWNLAAAGGIGLSLLFTRLTFGADATMANSDHLIGALILTVISIAAAEIARPIRFMLIPLGLALCITPFVYGASGAHLISNIFAGAAVVALSCRRSRVDGSYGRWSPAIP